MREFTVSGIHRGRYVLLAGAAALAVGLTAPVMAQQQGSQGQAQAQGGTASSSPQQNLQAQLTAVGGSLRQSHRQLATGQSGGQDNSPPNWEQARRAVTAGQDVLGKLPEQAKGQEAFRNSECELQQAQQALQGQQPDRQKAASELQQAADALSALMRSMGGHADAAGSQGQNRTQVAVQQAVPQINVQQPAPTITVQQPQPQITVQQPAPQVTIQQPQPQVTIQQPEPRVTVQQAQPQVRVQQAEPQVNVQRAGEPQVTVQREGQPQVVTRQEGQTQQNQTTQGMSQNDAAQRSGASSSTMPVQSGGQAQRVVASPAAGLALNEVQNLVGTNVVGANGRDAGEVRNLLIDNSGRVRAAVVEWGGFLGIGERQAMIPIERIRLGNGSERARLEMTREELEALPRYEPNRMAEYGRERGWGEGLRLFR